MIYLLFGAGCWFTFRTGFVQFRYIRQFGKSLKNSIHPQPGGLTSFQSLCTSLAARVGSGNLAGVALAITAGGPGAVFWMWVAAFIGMATSFAECSLAQLYKERDANGQFRGGPAWYMARGLGMRWMGVLFAVFLSNCSLYFLFVRRILVVVVRLILVVPSSLLRELYCVPLPYLR